MAMRWLANTRLRLRTHGWHVAFGARRSRDIPKCLTPRVASLAARVVVCRIPVDQRHAASDTSGMTSVHCSRDSRRWRPASRVDGGHSRDRADRWSRWRRRAFGDIPRIVH